MKSFQTTQVSILLSLFLAVPVSAAEIPQVEEVAILTDAPEVPPTITRNFSSKVKVDLEVKELNLRLADGVQYTYWTFGGKVPGKFIRIREGDTVEFTLHNHPSSKLPHNIDLHAVTGQGGGAAASFVAPGHSHQFTFKALNPGLYVYHCATAPVGMHIANGMYGLIFVQPKEGLPKVDREFYVMQSEFYTKGKYGAAGLQPFDMNKAVAEKPDYVVFNGSVGSLVGDNAMKAKAGETIRLFVGNGGPNLVSSFHVIGEIFDSVYIEGGKLINHNVQTTIVPAGGSAIVDFKAEVPSNLVLVDHSIFRAFNKGAIGMIKVEGSKEPTIFDDSKEATDYKPVDIPVKPQAAKDLEPIVKIRQVSSDLSEGAIKRNLAEANVTGKKIFESTCFACHQLDGKGLPGAFPPLAKSDYIANKNKAISAVVHGLDGKVKVNGIEFNSVMPPQALSDDEVSAVLNFVYSSWGNKSQKVSIEEVKKIRAAGKVK